MLNGLLVKSKSKTPVTAFSPGGEALVFPSLMSRILANSHNATVKWHEFGATYDHGCIECKFILTQRQERGRSFPKLFSADIATENSQQWIKKHFYTIKGGGGAWGFPLQSHRCATEGSTEANSLPLGVGG